MTLAVRSPTSANTALLDQTAMRRSLRESFSSLGFELEAGAA